MPTSTNGTAIQLLARVLSDFGEGRAAFCGTAVNPLVSILRVW